MTNVTEHARPDSIEQKGQDSRKHSSAHRYGTTIWELIERIRQLSVPEKNKRAFAAAQFALRQKQLILAEEHPDWSAERVEREARLLVFGISDKSLP